MTLSTSAVAVCCSRASSSSRLSRAIIFSVERVALLRRLTGLRRGIFDRVTRPWRPIGALETLKTVDRSRRASRLEGTQFGGLSSLPKSDGANPLRALVVRPCDHGAGERGGGASDLLR